MAVAPPVALGAPARDTATVDTLYSGHFDRSSAELDRSVFKVQFGEVEGREDRARRDAVADDRREASLLGARALHEGAVARLQSQRRRIVRVHLEDVRVDEFR